MTISRRLFRRVLCHNDNHFIPVSWGGETYPLCTRCTGMFSGFLFSVVPIILLEAYNAPGNLVFLAGIAFALPDYLYWGLTRIDLLPNRNAIRVLNGFLLGIGITLVGQANISWLIKLLVTLGMFLPAILLHPILGRKKISLSQSHSKTKPEPAGSE
jgi:uncharacterized membrane protein